MRRGAFVAAFVMVCGSAFGQQQAGVAARSKPDDYAVHVSAGGRTYAASVLSPDQVKHMFASDISKKYVVFEVACYPDSGVSMEIRPDSFVVNGREEKDPVRSADPITVASQMQRKNPSGQSSGTTQVYTEANVGYETGTDPYTGRRTHGTYGGGGVGVGREMDPHGSPRSDWPQDTGALERQLEDRSLPGGRFDRPVAGYLYFSSALLKKTSKGPYELKYVGDVSESVLLSVPAKNR